MEAEQILLLHQKETGEKKSQNKQNRNRQGDATTETNLLERPGNRPSRRGTCQPQEGLAAAGTGEVRPAPPACKLVSNC